MHGDRGLHDQGYGEHCFLFLFFHGFSSGFYLSFSDLPARRDDATVGWMGNEFSMTGMVGWS